MNFLTDRYNNFPGSIRKRRKKYEHTGISGPAAVSLPEGVLTEEHDGGCVLYEKRAEVERCLLQGAERN